MLLELTGELIVTRCWCGIQHAVPESLRKEQLRKHERGELMEVFCPIGHAYVLAGESEKSKVERELQRERQRLDQMLMELRDTRNALNAQKAAKSRLKNRVANGVCPCCNRTFANLQRHMEHRHPEFKTNEA